MLKEYLAHWLQAGNAHSIHSPFVYNLYNEVIQSDYNYYAYRLIESVRAQLLLTEKKIYVRDFGAGSHTNNNKKRSISSIAKNSSVNASKGRLLFRLANYFQPHTMLELGTSLGLSAMYLAGYSQNASLITLEGNPDSATIAKNNWEKTGIKNIECVTGNFHETLDPALKNLPNIDLAYIDGNHTYRATIDNCKKIMQRMHEDAVLILDDIHWSHEMKKAWDELSALPEISVSIDLFDLGLLFFKKDQEKEHFILRFNPKKPAL